MCGKDKGDARLFIELLHDLHDLLAVLGVEVGGGFVSEDQFGVSGKRPGDRDALLLSAGELVGAVDWPGRSCPLPQAIP